MNQAFYRAQRVNEVFYLAPGSLYGVKSEALRLLRAYARQPAEK